MFDTQALDQAMQNVVVANNHRTFVNSASMALGVRIAMYGVLKVYGVDDPNVCQKASNADLATLYASVRKDQVKGGVVARRIASKYAYNPLFDDTPPAGQPAPMPAPMPAPSAPLPIDIDLSNYVTQRELADASMMALNAVRDECNAVRDQTALSIIAGIEQALKERQATHLIVTMPNAVPVTIGLVHEKTPDIIKAVAAGVNVYLHGPAGTGKTTVARIVANAFGLPFYFAAKVESEYLLLGFKDARGETVRTQFREAYEHGGVFLFDELDGSSPQAVVALNAALANGICPFPDGVIARHENFKCIGAGNTRLGGASRQYVGRQQLDAASIDRFAFIEFGYDEKLERELASNQDWCAYVQAVRKVVLDRALNHLVTPRATLDGCKLLEAGFDWETVSAMVLFKGLDTDTVDQIQRAASRPINSAMAA